MLQLLEEGEGEGVGVGVGLDGPGDGVGVGLGLEGEGLGVGVGLGVAPCEGLQLPDLRSDKEMPSSAALFLRSDTDMSAAIAALSALVLLIRSYDSYSIHDNYC